MAVARSYRDCEILCAPFIQNGRKYVNIKTPAGTERRVRYYSDAEYFKMYGEEFAPTAPISEKDKLGFVNGYITIFKGNTYPHKDWLKEHGARFTKLFNWSFASDVEWPEAELPIDLEPLQIPWEAVSADDHLLPEAEVRSYIESLMYDPSNSEYVGEIGDRIEETLTVTKAVTLESYYGTSIMHIMEDAIGNVFVWITKAKNYPEGKVVTLRGTIKDHKEYKGTKQTILTRCKEMSIDE